MISKQNLYIVLNPIAGHSNPEKLQETIKEFCKRLEWEFEVYLTTGEEEEDVAGITQDATEKGATIVVAAGGDGTVAGVINGLVHRDIPLAILPAGTGNGLARAMRIPLDQEKAMNLIAEDFKIQTLDVMRVKDHFYVLNVSAGISSKAMEETLPEDKQRFGMIAYAQTILKDVMEIKPVMFSLTLDGLHVQVKATEVLIANGQFLKGPPFLFGPRDKFNDGTLEVNILTAEKPTDYVALAWDLLQGPDQDKSELHDLRIRESITIETPGGTQSVQADGELIGETPVEIHLVRNALKVLVPPDRPEENQSETQGITSVG